MYKLLLGFSFLVNYCALMQFSFACVDRVGVRGREMENFSSFHFHWLATT